MPLEKPLKFATGPTPSRPGPTLVRQPRVAVKAVVRETPSRETSRQPPPSSRG